MANPVHLLARLRVSPSRFLQTLKGYTARESESDARTHGPAILAKAESYDHSVRDERESDRIKAYIENNPVKAGLVANAEDYLGSSADRDRGKDRSSAPPTPPYVRIRIRRFDWLSY